MKKLKFSTWLVIVSVALFIIAGLVAMCVSEDTLVHNYCIAIMVYDLVFATPLWFWFMFAIQYDGGIYR